MLILTYTRTKSTTGDKKAAIRLIYRILETLLGNLKYIITWFNQTIINTKMK